MKLRLKTNLQSGNPTIGSWLTLGNADIAEVMARSGFDWLTVDLEHSHISLSQAGDLILNYRPDGPRSFGSADL